MLENWFLLLVFCSFLLFVMYWFRVCGMLMLDFLNRFLW